MTFIVFALATYRLSLLFAEEDGPWDMFERFRIRVGVRRDEAGRQYGVNNFATGLICQWCNSIWIGAVLTGAVIAWGNPIMWLCYPFALSSVTVFTERMMR